MLANYEYVYQCLKFSQDVRFVLVEKNVVRIGLTSLVCAAWGREHVWPGEESMCGLGKRVCVAWGREYVWPRDLCVWVWGGHKCVGHVLKILMCVLFFTIKRR